MQKLPEELKNTPWGASPAPRSVSVDLNREETLSDQRKVLTGNSSEENQQSGRTAQGLRVPVLNMRSEPLMPTYPAKARRLLQNGKAKVVRTAPFVIQLQYATGEATQQTTLGIDAGYQHVGFSVTSTDSELIGGTLHLRTDVSKRIEERRVYRRTRRGRKWYRKPRFSNRGRAKGWLPPSLRHKADSHIRLVRILQRYMPIHRIVTEVAEFDTHKMQHPEISGTQYQRGTLYGYTARKYLLDKWGRKCAYCGRSQVPLEMEHIIPKSRGGSNRITNLAIACRQCNKKKDNRTAEEFGYPNIGRKATQALRATAFMNTVRRYIAEELGSDITYGDETQYLRIQMGLEKSHHNDAFTIAGGSTQSRSISYSVTQRRRNNRKLECMRRRIGRSVRRMRHPFQPGDVVRYKGVKCSVIGAQSGGAQIRLDIGRSIIPNKITLIKHGKGMQFQQNGGESCNSFLLNGRGLIAAKR